MDRWNWYYFRYNKINSKRQIRNDWTQTANCERKGIENLYLSHIYMTKYVTNLLFIKIQ